MKKRIKKKWHKKYLEDIVLEISLSSHWRNAIFNLDAGQFLTICSIALLPLPQYIKANVCKYNLRYIVRKVDICQEKFDDGLIVFEFYPECFPGIKHFSGNNPRVT